MKSNMKAVILAGGLGKRLEPFTKIIPKPLLPLGEKTILEVIIQRLKMFGVTEVIIATNYKSGLFERYFGYISQSGLKIVFSKELEPLGTAGPIKLVAKSLKEPFIVMNGDILTTIDFNKMKKLHKEAKAKMTVATKEVQVPFHYGVIESDDGVRISNIKEKPSVTAEINGGIYIVNPEVVKEIPDGFYQMTDLVKKLVAKKMNVVKYAIDDYWLDIGQMHNYKKAQEDFGKIDFLSHDIKE